VITDIQKELILLCEDIYNEGYICGLTAPNQPFWFHAYTLMINDIMNGESFDSDLLIKHYHSLREGLSE
jgi:hypothetical protein